MEKKSSWPPGERLNGIQAAERAGIDIPRYCWHPGLSVVASCRMCLVETGTRHAETGAITMLPKLVPACQTPATDNTVFVTNSAKVEASRAMVEEDLLIDHPIDCPICDKAGECYLQDYHFKYGQDKRRADVRPFTSRRREMGDTVTLFVDRCVMCTRCVRFTREISGTSELFVINRGSDEEIDVFPGHPLANKMSGNVVDLCPVGALGDKDFLVSAARLVHEKAPRRLHRLLDGLLDRRGRESRHGLPPQAAHQSARQRVVDVRPWSLWISPRAQRPAADQRAAPRGRWICQSRMVGSLGRDRRTISRRRATGAILSPHLTVEEAYLLAKYVRQIDPQAVVALGPVPMVGHDETFKNGFTIRAEKCPNRRGVEEIVNHFMGRVASMDDLLAAIDAGEIGAVWASGGYKERLDRRRHGRAARGGGLPGRARFVRFAADGAGHVSIAGGGVRGTRWLVRQPCRPAAKRGVGDPSAGRGARRGGRLLAVVGLTGHG